MNKPYTGNEVQLLVKGFHPDKYPNRSARRNMRQSIKLNNRKPTAGRLTRVQLIALFVNYKGQLVKFKDAIEQGTKVTFAGIRRIFHKNYSRFTKG